MKNLRLKIGNITLSSFATLAPLAGYSDRSFRLIAGEFGAGLLTTEMINANALVYRDKKTFEYLNSSKGKYIEAVQIFGHDPEIIARAINEVLNERDDYKFIDLNYGCPAPKIVKNGDGAALLRDPYLSLKIAEAAVKASKKPITCKMRLGFSKDMENFLEIARLFESVGVSAITLHARYREDFYQGEARWDKIRELVETVKIPVIGNGDIETYKDAFRMIKETNCQGVAIGRGAIGNPWIFRDIKDFNEEREVKKIDSKELFSIIKLHYKLMIEEKGEDRAVKEMRKHIAKYLRGIFSSAKEREKLMTLDDYQEVLRDIEFFLKGRWSCQEKKSL